MSPAAVLAGIAARAAAAAGRAVWDERDDEDGDDDSGPGPGPGGGVVERAYAGFTERAGASSGLRSFVVVGIALTDAQSSGNGFDSALTRCVAMPMDFFCISLPRL